MKALHCLHNTWQIMSVQGHGCKKMMHEALYLPMLVQGGRQLE